MRPWESEAGRNNQKGVMGMRIFLALVKAMAMVFNTVNLIPVSLLRRSCRRQLGITPAKARQRILALQALGLPAMAGGVDMTSATMAVWTPEKWSTKATITYRGKTILVPLLDHRWEPELGVGQGDIVNIPGFTQNATPSNRGAGTGTFGTGATTTYSAATESQLQLQVNRLYYKAHRAPVESKAQTMPAYWPMLAEGHATAIQVQIDTDIAADNTNGFDAFTTVVGTDNVDLTEDDLLTISTNLLNQNADQGVGKTVGVVSPASKQSLLKVEAFRNSLYGGSLGNIEADKGQGAWGKLLNFDMYVSNLLESGTTGKKNAFFQQEAIAFAEQIKLQSDHDFNQEDGFFEQYATWTTCGFLMVKNSFGNEADGK